MLIINALLLLRMSAYAYAYVQVKTSLKTLANEYTLLPTQMFPSLPARATFVADTKMFLILFRNILCPQKMFPRQCVLVCQGLNCARKFTCHVIHRARELNTKLNDNRADGHC